MATLAPAALSAASTPASWSRKVLLAVAALVSAALISGLGIFTAPASHAAPAQSVSASGVLSTASSLQGIRYRHGGSSPASGFDCSGYVKYVFAANGKALPRTAAQMASVATPIGSPAPGDLVFVHKGRRGAISHVAIYAGNGMWYEATRPGRPSHLNKAWTGAVTYGRV